MFCVYCGKKINDEANFCPYCGSKLKDTLSQESQMTNNESSSKENKKKLTISAVENALLKATKTEDKILLLKIAGDAYASGDIGARKDYNKAIEYYNFGVELGSLECLHNLGTTYISAYWGEDEMLFSIGVAKVCDSYKKGYVPARDTLQYLVDNVFENCKTVEDLLDLTNVV